MARLRIESATEPARPRVTVVVTLRNDAMWLPEWSQAAATLIGPSLQLVVVDDACLDHPETWLQRVPAAERIRFGRTQGRYAALNAGLAAARAPYVAFWRSEVRPDRASLLALAEFLEQNPGIQVAAPLGVDADSRIIQGPVYACLDQLSGGIVLPANPLQGQRADHPSAQTVVSGPLTGAMAFMARTDVVRAQGGFNEEYREVFGEFDLMLRLGPCALLPQVHVRVSGGGIAPSERADARRFVATWQGKLPPQLVLDESGARLPTDEERTWGPPPEFRMVWQVGTGLGDSLRGLGLLAANLGIGGSMTVIDRESDDFSPEFVRMGMGPDAPAVQIITGPLPVDKPFVWVDPKRLPEPGAWPRAAARGELAEGRASAMGPVPDVPEAMLRPVEGTPSVTIFDLSFPDRSSAFRFAEFGALLDRYPDAVTLTLGHRHGDNTFAPREAYEGLLKDHPGWADRLRYASKARWPKSPLAYCVFLNTAFMAVEFFEEIGQPFAFTLYPGGGFLLQDRWSDHMLRRVCASPMFRGLVATMPVTRDYLLSGGFCRSDQIAYSFGVVLPTDKLTASRPPRRERSTLDIAFTAFKYMNGGFEKGFDVFLEAAAILASHAPEARFHVVGNFDASDAPPGFLAGRLTFHGPQRTDWFPEFYSGIDLLVSPNRAFIPAGRFDGFPTGSAVEAGLCGVAVMASDPLGLNDRFAEGREIITCLAEPMDVARRILDLRAQPGALRQIGEKGRAAFLREYSLEHQLKPRLALFDSILANSRAA